ncbi:hypothetical protein ACFQ4O_02075 [Methylopila musalis]|uniref:Uncharacterized protein n=1 Tax=Methylopila musalis TaxID=1134781 RepID=A0ABW3Z3C8_9HYPH
MSLPNDMTRITDEDIAAIETEDEAVAVMAALDHTIGATDAQISSSRARLDPVWATAARRFLKAARRRRNAAQERRGAIRRAAKERDAAGRAEAEAKRSLTFEAHFYAVVKSAAATEDFRRWRDEALSRVVQAEPAAHG